MGTTRIDSVVLCGLLTIALIVGLIIAPSVNASCHAACATTSGTDETNQTGFILDMLTAQYNGTVAIVNESRILKAENAGLLTQTASLKAANSNLTVKLAISEEIRNNIWANLNFPLQIFMWIIGAITGAGIVSMFLNKRDSQTPEANKATENKPRV